MKRTRYCILVFGLLAGSAQADDFSISAANWNFAVQGSVRDGDSSLDFDKDLAVRPREKIIYSATWNTGPGLWPDLAAGYAPIRAGGEQVVTNDTGLLGIPIGGSTATIAADADLDDLELSLRYPLTVGSAALSLGITLRQLRGDILVKEESDAEARREAIDKIFPMAHLQFRWPLANWLSLEAAGNYVADQGDRAEDYRVQATALLGPLSLSGGWQYKSFRINSNSYLLDADLSGAFAGLGFVIRP